MNFAIDPDNSNPCWLELFFFSNYRGSTVNKSQLIHYKMSVEAKAAMLSSWLNFDLGANKFFFYY